MNAGFRRFVKIISLGFLTIFFISVIFSLILLVSLNKNLDEEKSKIERILFPTLDKSYRNKQISLKQQSSTKYTFTSISSENNFLNIQHSIIPGMGLYELQIGLRSHKSLKECRQFKLQLFRKGRPVSPYYYVSSGLRKHLLYNKNSVLERFANWRLTGSYLQEKKGRFKNITASRVKNNIAAYSELAINPTIPLVILKKLFYTNNKRILNVLAGNARLSTELLKSLAIKLADDNAINSLLKHNNSNESVLKILLQRSRENIDLLLATNSRTPSSILSIIAKRYRNYENKVHAKIKDAVLVNKSTPGFILEQQLQKISPRAYYALAMNPAMDDKLLLIMIQRADLLDAFKPNIKNQQRKIVYDNNRQNRKSRIVRVSFNIRTLKSLKENARSGDFFHYVTIADRNPLSQLDPYSSTNHNAVQPLSFTETLLLIIAANPNAGKAVLKKLHQQSLFAIDNLISQHKNAPEKLLEKIYRKKQWSLYHYQRNNIQVTSKKLERIFLERLLISRQNLISQNIAARNNLKSQLLIKIREAMIKNATPLIAPDISSNSSLSVKQYTHLLRTKSTTINGLSMIRKHLASNPHTPDSILQLLVKIRSNELMVRLLRRKYLSSEVLTQILLNARSPKALTFLAKRKDLSPIIQKYILVEALTLRKLELHKPTGRYYNATAILFTLARNKSISGSILEKLAELNIGTVNDELLSNPKMSDGLRRKMLSPLFAQIQCRYFIAYDPKLNKIDRLIIKRKVNSNSDQEIFNIVLDRDAYGAQPVLGKEVTIRRVKPQNLPLGKNVHISSRQSIYVISPQSRSLLVFQANQLSTFNSRVLGLVSWIASKLVSSQEFHLNKNHVQLDSKSFVNYYISNSSYILILYFSFIVISLMLLAVLIYSAKIRRQRRALAGENDKLDSNMRRKAYIAELLGHEIKSPLHSLQQLLMNDKKSQSLIERIKQAILRFADIEAEISGLDGVITEIDLNDFLDHYCQNAQQYKSIEQLRFEPSVSKLKCFTSAEDLEIVLDHIINNANDFRTANTGIKIRAIREADNIVITITNQGPPIPDELLPHLFEFGSSSRSHTNTENLGQGLFVASEKLKELNASIRAFNVEHGVTFEITFPLNRH